MEGVNVLLLGQWMLMRDDVSKKRIYLFDQRMAMGVEWKEWMYVFSVNEC